MHEEQLTLAHREIVQNALKTNGVPLSEYSYTNLYLFRDVHKYTIAQDGPCSCIKGVTRDGESYAMPLCHLACIDMEKIRQTAEIVGMIFPVMERDLERFDPAIFEWSHNIDDSDYLFTVEKMATFPGRHLHKKRNLLKQFLELYSWHTEPLTGDKVPDAMTILNEWQKGTGADPSASDYYSCAEALSDINGFKLTGEITYVNGIPAGFLLGEHITSDTYALHFAKGITLYKGLYQFMYNHFAKSLEGSCTWINFEQDLGIQALRQAKESYVPDMMEHKYRVKIRKS
jgi:hypothetical protein